MEDKNDEPMKKKITMDLDEYEGLLAAMGSDRANYTRVIDYTRKQVETIEEKYEKLKAKKIADLKKLHKIEDKDLIFIVDEIYTDEVRNVLGELNDKIYQLEHMRDNDRRDYYNLLRDYEDSTKMYKELVELIKEYREKIFIFGGLPISDLSMRIHERESQFVDDKYRSENSWEVRDD